MDTAATFDRILVVATRQIGDVLLTTPLVRAARRRWPRARIEVLGFQGTLGMLAGNPDVDATIELPARLGWRGGIAAFRRLWRRYDLALITDVGDRAHALGWVAARQRSGIVAPDESGTPWKRRLLDHAVIAAGDRGIVHTVVEKHALLAPWLDASNPVPPVTAPAAVPLPPELASVLRPGAVVVHAPSMWSYKQWPIEHYADLVRGLIAQGRQVVLTGSSSARDQECIAPLRAMGTAPDLVDTSGQLGFGQIVTLLRQAALYVGPDTSVSHLAAATGVPVVALFGPSNPMRWAPWPAVTEQPINWVQSGGTQGNGNVTVLQARLPCVPCGRAGCEDHRASRADCLPLITPDRVLAEVDRLAPRPSAPA
ncbi:glycosyltransferase family 9 protein [Ramlibacter algicola]|uniref:Glycosyltransferase family 9 protein n=1 Tax=Ramlibacter algicola TaxID=2795217 RepID=A0A934PZA2_9BURK|nr:glycosyltransferase family 9 protein [Ramlibacter algicola]MBK0393320.1 glycosyltransferase family 9 protein [Ramlibacter algicola]